MENINPVDRGGFEPTMRKVPSEIPDRAKAGEYSYGCKEIMVKSGYESLFYILTDALDQAQAGKGSDRHANGKKFTEQPIMEETRAVGTGFVFGQARKKILEASRCYEDYPHRAVADLLGAINYIAAGIIYIKEQE